MGRTKVLKGLSHTKVLYPQCDRQERQSFKGVHSFTQNKPCKGKRWLGVLCREGEGEAINILAAQGREGNQEKGKHFAHPLTGKQLPIVQP